MVKQSPFQKDLFDFSYIENQVKNLKKSVNQDEETVKEQTLTELLNLQLTILQDMQSILLKIEKNTEKRGLFQTK